MSTRTPRTIALMLLLASPALAESEVPLTESEPPRAQVIQGGSPPIALPDFYVTRFEEPLVVPTEDGVLRNDLDPDGGDVVATSVSQAQLVGTVTLFADGRFNYTPPEDFAGLDRFTYRMRDDEQNQSESIDVTIRVLPAPFSKPIGLEDTYGMTNDQTLAVPTPGVLLNDIDLQGEALTVTQFNESELAGDVTMFADGRFNYTPPDGFTGEDRFTYRMRDESFNTSNQIWVTIQVLPAANLKPETSEDHYYTPVNALLRVRTDTVLRNDLDPENEILTVVNNSSPNNGQVSMNADGEFDFEPSIRFEGLSIFEYVASDGVQESAPTRVVIHVGEFGGIPTGVLTPPEISPLRLKAAVPNPFNPRTTTSFELSRPEKVRMLVYDLRGRVVATLLNQPMDAGVHEVAWDGRDAHGASVASGTYVFELRAGADRTAIKVQLAK